jgi:hypothetical protein
MTAAEIMAATREAKSAPGWAGKQYAPRAAGWHLRCCEAFGVRVERTGPHWWSAAAYTRGGALLYATGGRTRRHAETNALDGAGAPMTDGDAHALGIFSDDGPS